MDYAKQTIFDVGSDLLLDPTSSQLAKMSYRYSGQGKTGSSGLPPDPSSTGTDQSGSFSARALRYRIAKDEFRARWAKQSPSMPLVGIETNPGPLTKAQKLAARTAALAKVVAASTLGPNRVRPGRKPKMPQGIAKRGRSTASVATTNITRQRIPQQRFLPNGDVVVTHREYFNDIASSKVAFECGRYDINPGNSRVFPWLSRISLNYESYKFLRLRFCFETEQPTSIGGSVMLGIDFDSNDPTPGDKLTLMSKKNSERSAPWAAFCTTADTADLSKRSSYFTGVTPVGKDPNLYNTGVLFAATQGIPTTSNPIGELYVEYAIRFSTAQYSNLDMGSVLFNSPSPGLITTTQLIPSANSLPPVGFSSVASIDTALSTVTFLKPGYYISRWFASFNSALAGNTITVTPNATSFGTANVAGNITIKDSGGLYEDHVVYIKITNIGQTITWSASSFSAVCNNTYMLIAAIDPTIGTFYGLPA